MLFGSTRAFQNGMTWPISTKDHGAAPPQAKGLCTGQVLPGGDWTVVLPTQKLLDTNLATPESFTPIGLPIQNLVYIIQSTKTPNHKHTAPLYGNWWLKSKNKNAHISKNSISGGVCFIQNCKFLPKKLPPPTLPLSRPAAPHLGLSKMVWHIPIAPKTMEEIDFWQKAWVQARAYPIGTGQVYYPPKSYWAPT